MAKNYSNKVKTSEQIYLAKGEPLDVKAEVESVQDVKDIWFPYKGLIFYIKSEDKHYKVDSVKDGFINLSTGLYLQDMPVGNEHIDWNVVRSVFIGTYSLLSGDVNLTGIATETYVNNKVKTDVPLNAKFTDTIVNISGKADKTEIPTKTSDLQNDSGFVDANDLADLGAGDMMKSIYDTNNSGRVDDSDKVNGLTVQTAVPTNAKFTDTIVSITGKVDKVAGKSLILDTEVTRLSTVVNQDITGLATTAQLNAKVKTDVPIGAKFTDTTYTTLPASDVSAWAKANVKPAYTASEVGALPSSTEIPTKSSLGLDDVAFKGGSTKTLKQIEDSILEPIVNNFDYNFEIKQLYYTLADALVEVDAEAIDGTPIEVNNLIAVTKDTEEANNGVYSVTAIDGTMTLEYVGKVGEIALKSEDMQLKNYYNFENKYGKL